MLKMNDYLFPWIFWVIMVAGIDKGTYRMGYVILKEPWASLEEAEQWNLTDLLHFVTLSDLWEFWARERP